MYWSGHEKPPGPLELTRDSINDDCTIFLPFTEGEGIKTKNLATLGYGTWTVPAGWTWARDANGSYVRGDGVTAMTCPNQSRHNVSFGGRDLPLSILLSVMYDSDGTFQVVINRSGGAGANLSCWNSYTDHIKRFFFTMNQSNNTANRIAFTAGVYAATRHLFMLITYDGSHTFAGVKMYLDGDDITSTLGNGTNNYPGMSNTNINMKANETASATRRFYQVRIWRRVITPGEAVDLYRRPWLGCQPMGQGRKLRCHGY